LGSFPPPSGRLRRRKPTTDEFLTTPKCGPGALVTANAVTVVLVQVPVARMAEGRRRTVMISLAAALFAGACLIVVGAGLNLFGPLTFAALVMAAIAVGVGECLHTSVLMPLVADLAARARQAPRGSAPASSPGRAAAG